MKNLISQNRYPAAAPPCRPSGASRAAVQPLRAFASSRKNFSRVSSAGSSVSPSAPPASFTYNRLANSNLLSSVVGPVHTVTNTYEPNRDTLTSKQNRTFVGASANTIASQYDYTVNAIGQRTARSQSGTAFIDANTDTFSYNLRCEVTSSANNQTPANNRAYSYDPIGNRLNATECLTTTLAVTKTYTSNSLNHYTRIQTSTQSVPSAVTPTYDDDGNMLTDGTGKSYQWDCENRLIQVTLPTGEVVKYHYDADGRRIKREHTTQTLNDITIYLYDDWNVIYEPNQKSQTADNEITSIAKSYIWGLDLSDALQGAGSVGGLLATKTINFGSTQFCFHTYDANGTLSIPVKWSYNIPKKIPGLQSTSDSAWGKNGITWNLFAKSQWTKEQVPIDVNNGGDFLITITWDNCCGNDVFAVKVNRNFSIKKKRFGSIKERDDAAQWRAQGR